jgi:hypothetical protein
MLTRSSSLQRPPGSPKSTDAANLGPLIRPVAATPSRIGPEPSVDGRPLRPVHAAGTPPSRLRPGSAYGPMSASLPVDRSIGRVLCHERTRRTGQRPGHPYGDELPPHVERDRSAHRDRIRCPRARRADSLLLANSASLVGPAVETCLRVDACLCRCLVLARSGSDALAGAYHCGSGSATP